MKLPTLSIRLVWPFARLMSDYRAELAVLREAGLGRIDLADPEGRLPEPLVMELARTSLAKTGDRALGLHAGERVEAGDFGVMEYAARSCANLGQALRCCSRYMRLLDEGSHASVVEHGDTAAWVLRPLGMAREPVVNDFSIVAAMRIGWRLTGVRAAPTEVHFVHREPTDELQYARIFGCPIRFGQPANAIVMPRIAFDLPLVSANDDLFAAFDVQAERQLARLSEPPSVAARVQDAVVDQLGAGRATMPEAAARLHMSVATLRRRLDEEGTSHREIVDRVRHALALEQLRRASVSVSEVAFLLGFSSVQAFSRAFRRWTASSPAQYRSGQRVERQAS